MELKNLETVVNRMGCVQTPFEEILDDMQRDPSLISDYKLITSIYLLLAYAFLDNLKFKLPEDVEYKASTYTNENAPMQLRAIVKTFDVFLNENISEQRRVHLFQNILVNLTPKEAVILTHIKNQTLSQLYPNINEKTVLGGSVEEIEHIEIPYDIKIEAKPEPVVVTIIEDEIAETPKGGFQDKVKTKDNVSIVFVNEENDEKVEPPVSKPKRSRKKKAQ